MNESVTTTHSRTRPQSPCINVCTLDEHDVCTGCLRTLDEIGAWSTLTAEAQWEIVRALPGREAARRAVR